MNKTMSKLKNRTGSMSKSLPGFAFVKTSFNTALYLKDIREKSEALQSFRCLTKHSG